MLPIVIGMSTMLFFLGTALKVDSPTSATAFMTTYASSMTLFSPLAMILVTKNYRRAVFKMCQAVAGSSATAPMSHFEMQTV